jgi:predicted enzyme related to lactoylglutathione lyase
MKKVTGIGGIFFKCKEPDKMRDWYRDQLGLVTNEYGSLFEFRKADADEPAYLQWSTMSEGSDHFKPSKKEFMINYRVHDLEALKKELEKSDVKIVSDIESFEYGKFMHIMDPEGNKIELWEPIDEPFTKLYKGQTTK